MNLKKFLFTFAIAVFSFFVIAATVSAAPVNSRIIIVNDFDQVPAILQNALDNYDSNVTIQYTGNIDSSIESTIDDMLQKVVNGNAHFNNILSSSGFSGGGYEGNYIISFNFNYRETSEQINYVNNTVKKILHEIITTKMTDLQKEIAVENWIDENVSYDYSFKSCTPYYALHGHSAVCQGYAELNYVMLNMAGIKCIDVNGTAHDENSENNTKNDSHAWNKVKIDGKWYNLDSTWNDVYNPGSMRYFDKSDKNFLKTHDWDTSSVPVSDSSLNNIAILKSYKGFSKFKAIKVFITDSRIQLQLGITDVLKKIVSIFK